MKKTLLFLLISVFTLFIACQKEVSFTSGDGKSGGSLQDDANGECLPKTVTGDYKAGTALAAAANYIEVQVNVTKTGTYTVYTDTINGIYFRAIGSFTAAGLNTIKLPGTGTPVADGSFDFTVTYDTTECVVPVTVLPAGGTPPVAAVYTLDGSPGTCMDYTLQGTYTKDVPADASDKVIIKVVVTTPGTYSITTTLNNGLTFTGSGTLAAGSQTITLTANGTPSTAGTTNIAVTAGATSCSFPVVVAAAPSTDDYFPRTSNSNWSYEIDDDVNDTLLRVATTFTKAVGASSYTIFAATDNTLNGFDSSGYYRKAGGDYYEFVDMGGLWGLDDPLWVEYIFLKDNIAANTSWQSAAYSGTVSGNAITFRLNYKIAQKDASIVINGITYPNTIVVEEKLDVLFNGVWTDATSALDYYSKSYYARNVGVIKQEAFDAANTSLGQVELRRHSIF